jgi:Flp pilus assembly CpaF family ATPase
MADRDALLSLAGPVLGEYLDDTSATDILCNPNGSCFVRYLGQGKQERAHPGFQTLDTFLARIAHEVGAEWLPTEPRLSAALEDIGWRIQAARPPVAPERWMALRKHPKHVFPLERLRDDGILTGQQYAVLTRALLEGLRIVVGGGVGSAKTSLINSFLYFLRETLLRAFIAEDDPEVICLLKDHTREWRLKGGFGLREIVQDALRSDLDLLVIGELRGGEALDMLTAFQTGHGGLTTVHCKTMEEIPLRIEELVLQVSQDPQRRMIRSVIDLLVHMRRTGTSWECTGIGTIEGWDGDQYVIRKVA